MLLSILIDENILHVAPLVQDAHDFDRILRDAVENDVARHKNGTQPRAHVISRFTILRPGTGRETRAVDFLQELICNSRAGIEPNIIPNIEEVLPRLRRPDPQPIAAFRAPRVHRR